MKNPVPFLVGLLGLVVVVAWVILASRPVSATPSAGNPQYLEKIETPCLSLNFPANDGGVGYAEWSPGQDAGTIALQVGARYRVTTTSDVHLCKGTPASPGSCIFVSSNGTGEEISFSTKYEAPSTVYGFAVGTNATVTLCRIRTALEN